MPAEKRKSLPAQTLTDLQGLFHPTKTFIVYNTIGIDLKEQFPRVAAPNIALHTGKAMRGNPNILNSSAQVVSAKAPLDLAPNIYPWEKMHGDVSNPAPPYGRPRQATL